MEGTKSKFQHTQLEDNQITSLLRQAENSFDSIRKTSSSRTEASIAANKGHGTFYDIPG